MSSPYRRPRTQSTNEPPADIDDDSSAILQLKEVSKSFGPVNVIDRVSINVRPGQVHALLGENGAGKSTLIKMMSGVYQPDSGAIIIDGKQTHLPTSKAAEDLGIATIHQELNLVPTMTVAENVMLGRFPTHYGLVNHRKLDALAQEALDLIGVDVKLNDRIGNLGIARQQMVEIAKALSMHARILILDEPTAALTDHEIEQLFKVIRDLKAQNVAMVFISHHLDENRRNRRHGLGITRRPAYRRSTRHHQRSRTRAPHGGTRNYQSISPPNPTQ